MAQSKLLVDSNSYFRLARSIQDVVDGIGETLEPIHAGNQMSFTPQFCGSVRNQ